MGELFGDKEGEEANEIVKGRKKYRETKLIEPFDSSATSFWESFTFLLIHDRTVSIKAVNITVILSMNVTLIIAYNMAAVGSILCIVSEQCFESLECFQYCMNV